MDTRRHSEIIGTPLAFWTLGEKWKILLTAKLRGKTELVEKREKVGQLCPSTETGAVQGRAMVDSWCQLHPFNQAINNCIIT